MVDGELKQLLVHRKGSTRAFPPHHPLIPVDYQLTGQPVLIGGTMGGPLPLLLAICAKGMNHSGCQHAERSVLVRACMLVKVADAAALLARPCAMMQCGDMTEGLFVRMRQATRIGVCIANQSC